MRPIDAEVFEELFSEQIARGATDFFDAVEDALQDAQTIRCEDCSNYDAAFDCRSSCQNCERTLSLNPLRDEIYEDAVAHGLWDGVTQNPYKLRTYCADLLVEEVFELSEEYENVQCYIEELADVVIMSLSVAGKLGIDIDAAVRRKMEINKARPWKHGKDTNVLASNSVGCRGFCQEHERDI